MANRGLSRTESIVVTCGNGESMLEPFPSSPSALNTPALAFEHILASLARLEARMDALERGAAIAQPPPWPDPDPPHHDWQRGSGDAGYHRPLLTTATSVAAQPQLGFGGQPSHGPHRTTLSETSPWERQGSSGYGNRPRPTTSWDNPAFRPEIHAGGHLPAWDGPWGRHDGAVYSEHTRYDHYRSERPRYEKMKPPPQCSPSCLSMTSHCHSAAPPPAVAAAPSSSLPPKVPSCSPDICGIRLNESDNKWNLDGSLNVSVVISGVADLDESESKAEGQVINFKKPKSTMADDRFMLYPLTLKTGDIYSQVLYEPQFVYLIALSDITTMCVSDLDRHKSPFILDLPVPVAKLYDGRSSLVLCPFDPGGYASQSFGNLIVAS